MSVPFSHEGHQALGQMTKIGKVADLKPLALHDAEPLFDLIHPGAMRWQEMANEAWVSFQPSLNLLALMNTGVIEDEEDTPHLSGNLSIEPGKQPNEFCLAFAQRGESRDLAGARIKGSKQMQGTCPLVFVLYTSRQTWASRPGRGKAGPGLQVRLLIQTQHSLPLGQWAGVEINEKAYLLGKPLIPRYLWGKPQVGVPWLEPVRVQDSANGLKGNAGHDAIGLELAGEFGAVPLGEGTPKPIRPFTGQLDHIQSDLGRKDRRPTRARPFVQTRYPLFAKAPGPFAHMAFAQAHLSGCGSVGRSLCEQQERAGSSDQA